MLRSLINDPEHRRYGQPKPAKDMDAGEKHYVEKIAPARERDWQASRLRMLRDRFREDVRICVEQDIVEPKAIARKLGCTEQKVKMTLREMRLLD